MKAVIFDLDGVLVDTEKINFSIYRSVLERHGISLSSADYEKFMSGSRTSEAFESYLGERKAVLNSGELVKEFRAVKRETLSSNIRQNVKLMDGANEILTDLGKSFKLALATSTIKEFTDLIVDGFGLRKFFGEIVYAEDVKKGKPDPEVYLITAGRLKADPEDCVVVEDSPNGIKAAKNAGMKCICVGVGNNDSSKADVVVHSLKEINKKMVEGLKDA
jgi:HAD superfamily hydrolase (TIGR01509 family)